MKRSSVHFCFRNTVSVLSFCTICANAATNEPSVINGVARLTSADKAETTAYYSDREAEIEKNLQDAEKPQVDNEENREHHANRILLASIPLPVASDTMRDIIKSTLNMRFHKTDILPVWTGKKWVDGMPLALNGFIVPDEISTRLRTINFQERSFGIYFWPDEERRKRSIFSGFHPPDRFLLSRVVLENMGYELKFDKTFYIWRITGTNAPVACAP
jgi:hypothetical protein